MVGDRTNKARRRDRQRLNNLRQQMTALPASVYLSVMNVEAAKTREMLRQSATMAAELARDLQDLSRRPELSAEDWLVSLGRIGARLADLHRMVNEVSPALGLPAGAHDRLLAYMKVRVGEVVTKDELAGVAGISEWARRIRELRVEQGWPISTNANREDLRPGEYVLEATERSQTSI
jgi:hypothetical protein